VSKTPALERLRRLANARSTTARALRKRPATGQLRHRQRLSSRQHQWHPS